MGNQEEVEDILEINQEVVEDTPEVEDILEEEVEDIQEAEILAALKKTTVV